MEAIHTILVFIAAGLPLGLILIKIIVRAFAHHDLTLGKVSSICTNVIGSLTKRNLAVRHIYYDEHSLNISENNEFEIENLGTKEKLKIEQSQLQKEETFKLVAITSALCHYKKMAAIERQTNYFLAESGFSKNEIISRHQIISTINTDKKKKISTVVAKNLEDENIYAFSKGNPYALLKRCKRLQVKDQKIQITPTIRRRLKRRIDKLNKHGQKVIAFAYKGLPKKQYDVYEEQFAESDLIFTAVFAFINPINTEVTKSIQLAKENEIKIYIVTGTQEKKATALGIKLGLVNPHYFENITGSQLHDISDKKLSKMLSNKEKDYIFSEMKNSEKQIIFKALQKNGETIALTDKNDEKSLEKLMEKIIEGRNFHQGYLKCIYHSFSLKVAELFILITALISQSPIAITLTSLITIEVLVNSLLGLSLKAERSNHKFQNSFGKIITEGVIMGIILSILYIFSSLKHGWIPGQSLTDNAPLILKTSTIIFVTITIFQIINAYRIKNSGSSIASNVHLLLSSIILLLAIYALTNIGIIKDTLGFTSLNFDEWQIIGFSTILFLSIHHFKKKIHHATNPQTGLPENQSAT